MSKKLNIIEAMKMPIGTEFKVTFENGETFDCHAKIIESKVQSKKQLVWDNRANTNIFITDLTTGAILVPIQQPVSFMEVVNSKEDCRVEHLILDIIIATKEDNSYNYEFNNKGYLPLNCLLHILGGHLGVREVKKVIWEGKWYIEESEADSNE